MPLAGSKAALRGTAFGKDYTTVIFEFLVAYRRAADTDIRSVLVEALTKVVEDNFNDFEQETLGEMIRLRHERAGEELADGHDELTRRVVLGFAVDLPDDTELCRTVVDEFAAALADLPLIGHVVKFEDPVLRTQLANWAEEMFDLEMKLRRVLTLI